MRARPPRPPSRSRRARDLVRGRVRVGVRVRVRGWVRIRVRVRVRVRGRARVRVRVRVRVSSPLLRRDDAALHQRVQCGEHDVAVELVRYLASSRSAGISVGRYVGWQG